MSGKRAGVVKDSHQELTDEYCCPHCNLVGQCQICELNRKIAELKLMVHHSYIEGYNDGRVMGKTVESADAWSYSFAKENLDEI